MTDGPATPPPGWYPDPTNAGDQRWWDGHQWTDKTRPPTMSSDWRGWLARSPRAETIGRIVACAAALGTVGAFLVSLAALVREKPIHGLLILLVPAIPILVVGQLWAVATMNARMPRRARGWRGRMRATQATTWNPRSFFFGDLPSRFARPLIALAFLGCLSSWTAFGQSGGDPSGAGDGCPYRLDSHGTYTCVSQRTYERTGAGEQQFASGVLLAMFAIQTGSALGGLHRRPASSGAA